MKNQNIGKNVRNLALRYIMFCGLVFMCIPLITSYNSVLGPLFGVFYFAGLIYYFWFTMKVEGELDVNRVNIGQVPRFRWKGAVCALFLAVPLMILNIIPLFFHNPIPAEYRAYFTGQPTTLTAEDNFNLALKEISKKEGYISEITFTETGNITKIVYESSFGYTVTSVAVDASSAEQKEAYYIDYQDAEGKLRREYYPLNPDLLTEEERKALDSLDQGLIDAFTECREGLMKVSDVKNAHPWANWQTFLSGTKVVLMVCLSYFCSIFSPDNAVLTSVIYCLCMLVLVGAAQVGYDMGYNKVSFFRKQRPQKDSKAGDSVVIQRGGNQQ